MVSWGILSAMVERHLTYASRQNLPRSAGRGRWLKMAAMDGASVPVVRSLPERGFAAQDVVVVLRKAVGFVADVLQ